jgi:2-C-methyl-D-erythritol 2,4-cyclodiphosphate synthase
MNYRTGIGFDVHPFTGGRKFILGGIEIPFEKGLAGHSDADVLLHAIADALLGALTLGDIGQHFPDSEPQYKDISSSILLEKTYELIRQEGFELNNLDCVVLLEKPKIAPYIAKIQKNIADIFWCKINQISIKATTTERLGFVGRGDGAAALAMVMLRERKGK